MSSLQAQVQQVLQDQGLLAQQTPGFQQRPGQLAMAEAVAETLQTGGALVVEAGTGVGKTYAYLVPVLLSGERALVSTATKALQDQLFSRDIPRLLQRLHLPARVALLKGRASYLCLHRMQQARHSELLRQPAAAQDLGHVEQWAQGTRTGDLAELTVLDERSPVLPLVTSTRENCLGSACPQYRACHVNLARKEALAADLVVINHHLFFADLSVRESGVAELLPTVRVTVFDEAHQLNTIGVQFLGQQLSSTQLHELARDMMLAGLTLARGLVDWPALAQGLELGARDLRLAAGRHQGSVRLRWLADGPQGVDPQAWAAALAQLVQALQTVSRGLDTVTELAPDFVRLHERASEALAVLQHLQGAPAVDQVRWLEVSAQLRMIESPLDIARTLGALVEGPPPPSVPSAPEQPAASDPDLAVPATADQAPAQAGQASQAVAAPRSWIFTSATLGAEPGLRWFTEPCGLVSARVLQVESPFDYARQAAVYVPQDLPLPAEAGHPQAVAQLAAQGANALGGRTLVLTTTLQAMHTIARTLPDWLDPALDLQVLVQGQWPKRRLMEQFRAGTAAGARGCVLVASASFWEGFDVPGSALELVVIDKLPFPPPGDPLVQARSERLQAQGRSPFADHALPEATVALKQGAGRLIRSESDQGLLVIGDVRLRQKGYGHRMRKALPAMRWLEGPEDYARALEALTKASTTGKTC